VACTYSRLECWRPSSLPGHFWGNNLEQQLLALIFGRILTLLKHQLQCVSAYAVAKLGLALQFYHLTQS
jgi:hypothetical protein